MAVPHVTLPESTPDIEPTVLALRVSPARDVPSRREVHQALDLTAGAHR